MNERQTPMGVGNDQAPFIRITNDPYDIHVLTTLGADGCPHDDIEAIYKPKLQPPSASPHTTAKDL